MIMISGESDLGLLIINIYDKKRIFQRFNKIISNNDVGN